MSLVRIIIITIVSARKPDLSNPLSQTYGRFAFPPAVLIPYDTRREKHSLSWFSETHMSVRVQQYMYIYIYSETHII